MREHDYEYLRPEMPWRGVNGTFSRVFRSGPWTSPAITMVPSRRSANKAAVYASREDLFSQASLASLAGEFARRPPSTPPTTTTPPRPRQHQFVADSTKTGTLKVAMAQRCRSSATASIASPEHPHRSTVTMAHRSRHRRSRLRSRHRRQRLRSVSPPPKLHRPTG